MSDDWNAARGDVAVAALVESLRDELEKLGLPGSQIRERRHLQPISEEVLTGMFPGRVRGGRSIPLKWFQPNVGGFDLIVDRVPGRRVAWLGELKWSYATPDKIFEAAWDAVKLALARAQYGRDVARCWLITGASAAMWDATETPDLFADGEVDVLELWNRPLVPTRGPNKGATVGEDLEIGGGANMFVRCPRLGIERVAEAELSLSDGPWVICASAVEPLTPWIEQFDRLTPPPSP